jgi:3-(3-hydroxy-phenyl)propionate hydroxylase
MKQFRHGRVIFAGDSAHQVSPFGARGANSGMQDVDNLGWKLGLVINGKAPERLLDSYNEERIHGADENILNSTRATDFITPKSKISHVFRNAVLDLAEHYPFARPLVNSGRLSVPCTYDGLSLNGPDALPGGPARTRVGSACPDAPLGNDFLLRGLGGGFTLLTIGADAPESLDEDGIPLRRLALTEADDPTGAIRDRYLGTADRAVYLIRPDQHVAARWDNYDETAVRAALRRACAKD